MSRIIAIGDIHGCKKTFQKLLDTIRIRKSDTIYCLGDYIDRGPDSKGVIDLILHLRKQGYRLRTLRGNHEQMMLDSVNSEKDFEHWYSNGGSKTLESFGAVSFKELKTEYKTFFKYTRYYFEAGPYIFVHAGLNFSRQDLFEDKQAMLWIRTFGVDKQKLGERILVHGHTPKPLDEILNPEREYVFNLDAGCVHTHREGEGYLVARNFTDGEWIYVRNSES